MRRPQRLFWTCIIAVLTLAACGDSGGGLSGAGGLNPSPQLTLEQADQVAETFLKAWREGDFAAMYNLISPNSRDAYSDLDFTEEYQTAADQLTLNALTTSITGSLRQGTTAAIQYDVTFQTGFFGDIVDNGRTMRLIETPEGWRVAWSRSDILDDLEGARLERRQSLPARGNIYDRNGKVLVDQNGYSVALYIVRRDLSNEAACIDLLARIMRRETSVLRALFDRFSIETLFPVGEIDQDTFQSVAGELQQFCDVGDDANDTLIRRTRRYYGELAPHLIGYVGQIQPDQLPEYRNKGYPPDARIGQTGIEKAYEDELAGKPGGELLIIAPTGETLRVVAKTDPQPGQSVYLTIDRDLQEAVQDAFVEAYDFAAPTWAQTSKGGAAVVLDVKTGEVLAMVSYPGFNPSLFNPDYPDSPFISRAEEITRLNNDPRTPLVDRVTSALYPAGSVFKIVSTVAGLDSGVYTANTLYTCTAVWSNPEDALPRRTDWIYGTGQHGTINFPHALTYSCDPYFWELSVALNRTDPNLLPNYAYMLGLGVPTGQTDLPEEIGYIPNPEGYFQRNAARWSVGEAANLVIGQGQMQITPLQIARMMVAVANGGTLYKPLFVKKIGLIGEPPVYEAQPVPTPLDVDPNVLSIVREAMCQVTLDPNGTANWMFQDWYNWQENEPIVCGKTGTAQTGGEFVKPHAWFTAFVPRDDPQIAIVVLVENSCEGSEVSAPLTRRIVEDYYGLPHGELPRLWQTGCIDLGE